MTSGDGRLQIRSYHLCFRLERRLHRIDRWALPVPYGVPMRGIIYAVAVLSVVLVASRLPLLGDVLGLLHPVMRYVVLPGAAAWALTRWSIDGRSAVAAARAWVRWRCEPVRVASMCRVADTTVAALGDVTIAHDERSARMRRGFVVGPATVVLRYAVTAHMRRRRLHVTQRGGEPLWRGKQAHLRPGQRMVVR